MTHTHLLELINAYGYAFIFLGTFFEGELIVLAAAFLAHIGVLDLSTAMLVCFLGAISGDNFWYVVGKYGGVRFLQKYGNKIGFTETRYLRAHRFFDNHGGKTIFLARFVFGTRLITAMIAGSSGMPEKKYLKANIAGAALWVIVIGSLGYLFGKSFNYLSVLVKRTEIVLLILAVLAIIIVIFHLKSRIRKQLK